MKNKVTKSTKMYLPVKIDFEEVGDNLDEDEAIEFIKAIDRAQMDWEFTNKVAKHFVKEMQIWGDVEYCGWLKDVVVPKDSL